MITYWLKFILKSEAAFGRGEGVPGLVDEEVEYNQYGLPYLRGRTLKGLLVEECANLLYALECQTPDGSFEWQTVANRLFGNPGATSQETGFLRVSDACLPADLGEIVKYKIESGQVERVDILESLTDIRRQTSIDEESGRPQEGSLRSIRVILRETPFEARLQFEQPPTDTELALLTACILAFRRAGGSRNRGKGHLTARLLDESGQDVTKTYFYKFREAMDRC